MDIRNVEEIALARLRPKDDLAVRFPLGPGVLETKRNGHRYSLQLGSKGTYLTSRSKEGKTKGVEHAATRPYGTIPPPPWLCEISAGRSEVKLFDGEWETIGDSCASETGRLDTEKQYVVWDILKNGAHDLRDDKLWSRRAVAQREVQAIAHPRLLWVPSREYETFTQEDLDAVLATIQAIRDSGGICEGFVYKEFDRDYDLNWYGWKIKLEEPADGFIVARKEEFKHDHGTRTRTGRVGSVGVAMRRESDGKSQLVGWVALPEKDRCPLDQFDDDLKGRTMEFSHLGWDGKLCEFCQFMRWRSDKDDEQCLMPSQWLP